ncbi:MBL fold metallo-hydrolase, partial [Streptomyces galbus]|nr:MBL fold metallo-hydrolase [Streptomyces galbus]
MSHDRNRSTPHADHGPVDLRMVPLALAAWATAALTLDAAAEVVTGLVVACLVTAAVLLSRGRATGSSSAGDAAGRSIRQFGRCWSRVTVGGVLLCVAAAAGSAALHGADLRRGPVPGLA